MDTYQLEVVSIIIKYIRLFIYIFNNIKVSLKKKIPYRWGMKILYFLPICIIPAPCFAQIKDICFVLKSLFLSWNQRLSRFKLQSTGNTKYVPTAFIYISFVYFKLALTIITTNSIYIIGLGGSVTLYCISLGQTRNIYFYFVP